MVPRPPYRIQIYDVLSIRASGTLPKEPIDNYFIVQSEGEVDFGPVYGQARVAGLTLDEAKQAIVTHLRSVLREPAVSIQLARTAGTQEINGTYLVHSDGTINLRRYGAVPVAGKTPAEAEVTIEHALDRDFDDPDITVNVIGFNSKVFYVIRNNGAQGDEVIRIPVSGNDTVLDAVGKIGGLSRVSSTRMWIARPVPGGQGCEQILPVDYLAITRGARTTTNYQLMPGDRLYIAEDGLLAATGVLYQFTNPMYQVLGVSQLGAQTVQGLQMMGRAYNLNVRRGY
ncbi:MAG: polysaccharide biosynthesis/export family protein [Pirellulales bacterium]|nr:polysaccharide biosynthesis/export family protein [Pirellulales bacterium]